MGGGRAGIAATKILTCCHDNFFKAQPFHFSLMNMMKNKCNLQPAKAFELVQLANAYN